MTQHVYRPFFHNVSLWGNVFLGYRESHDALVQRSPTQCPRAPVNPQDHMSSPQACSKNEKLNIDIIIIDIVKSLLIIIVRNHSRDQCLHIDEYH